MIVLVKFQQAWLALFWFIFDDPSQGFQIKQELIGGTDNRMGCERWCFMQDFSGFGNQRTARITRIILLWPTEITTLTHHLVWSKGRQGFQRIIRQELQFAGI